MAMFPALAPNPARPPLRRSASQPRQGDSLGQRPKMVKGLGAVRATPGTPSLQAVKLKPRRHALKLVQETSGLRVRAGWLPGGFQAQAAV